MKELPKDITQRQFKSNRIEDKNALKDLIRLEKKALGRKLSPEEIKQLKNPTL